MALTTKGGRPKTRANADPRHSRCFTLYFYKTFGGRTEIRLVHKRQESGSTRWKSTGTAEIIKSADAAAARVKQLLDGWEQRP